MSEICKIGLVGARGYTGRELLRLIARHPFLELAFASSRQHAGTPIAEVAPEIGSGEFVNLQPDDIATYQCDIIIMALPDGAGAPFLTRLEEIEASPVIIDLSADKRFDGSWCYGLLELYGERYGLSTARRIANPGCYATAGQLAVFPVREMLATAPSLFGVSGFSGAGVTPSPRNDPERLRDNLMPYALTGHKHEREMSHHLGTQVYFTPHVHPAFSGILITAHLSFREPMNAIDLQQIFEKFYTDLPLIRVQSEAPELRDGTHFAGAIVGGFSTSDDGMHGVVIVAEDNLLKGAAVQAIQNVNIAKNFPELSGIEL